MARVTHRYQEHQRRTWCWSRPHSPLLARNASSTRQRAPATRTSAISGRPGGAGAQVVGQLPGGQAAADQQPAAPPLRRAGAGQRQAGPLIPAAALGALAGADAQPARRRDVLGQPRCRRRWSTRRWQRLGGLDGQHIGQLADLQPAAQRRAVAVDLVGGHPAGRHAGVQRALQHPAGQLRLGRKPDLVGDTGGLQARRVVNPALGQVQLAVDHPMPSGSCVGQVDGDLGVVDLAGGAGVLATHPHRAGALLEVAGLVDHQHRGGSPRWSTR